MEKGKYVSRAVYAKLQAENKRLMKDIELMAMGGAEGGVTWQKWRKHFKKQKAWMDALREAILLQPDSAQPKLDSAKGAFK
jgi:hypothetical protein